MKDKLEQNLGEELELMLDEARFKQMVKEAKERLKPSDSEELHNLVGKKLK